MKLTKLTLVLAAALMIGLIGCSKKDRKLSSNTFYWSFSSEPTTINPITATDAYTRRLNDLAMMTLLYLEKDGWTLEPAIAESYTASEDKMKFTFKLNKNAKFHDGTPITAEDVKFSFDVIWDPDYNTAHKRPYYEGIKEVKVIDKHTVEFTAKDKYYKNFEIMANTFIIPKHYYGNKENKKEWNKKLIGSGPYKLVKFEKGKKFILEKVKDWYGDNLPTFKGYHNFEKIVIKFVSEQNVSLEMLKKNQLDFLGFRAEDYVKKTDGDMWGKTVHKVKTKNKSPKGYNFIAWNMKNPILESRNVRKALVHLLNRDLFIEKFEYGFSTPAVGPVYPESPYAVTDVKPIAFNPQEANKILKAEGWKDSDGDGILDKVINGKKTKFEVTILEPVKAMEKYLTIFKNDAKKQGIILNIKLIEWNSFIKLIDERKFDAVRLAWSVTDIDWTPKQIWHSSSIKGGSNFISYSNKQVDKWIDESREIHDRDKRIAVLKKAQRQIIDDVPYAFFTFSENVFYGVTDRIEREKDTLGYSVGFTKWMMKKAK